MKVRYELQTSWPSDVANPSNFEAVDWHQIGEIPFLPVAGMLIDIDGDLRKIKEVYWIASEPDQVVAWLEDDERVRELAYMVLGGWQTADFSMPKTARRRGKA